MLLERHILKVTNGECAVITALSLTVHFLGETSGVGTVLEKDLKSGSDSGSGVGITPPLPAICNESKGYMQLHSVYFVRDGL